MLRAAGFLAFGAGLTGAIAMMGSDRWLAASYDGVRPHVVENVLPGSDEAELLAARPSGAMVVATAAPPATPGVLASRMFGIGARVSVAGDERVSLEVVSSQPVSAESGLLDAAGRPLILVTARERGKGTRLVRFLVEADRLPSESEKSL